MFVIGAAQRRDDVSGDDRNPVERPPGRIEILPPEDEVHSSGRIFYSSNFGSVKIVKLGPLASAAVAVGALAALALGFVFLSGALLLLIPLTLILGALAFLSRGFGRGR
jgi:hypothetical protein